LFKYTGGIATIIILLFAYFYKRDLFKNKIFLFSLALPIILLTPWFYWNYEVYGIGFLTTHLSLHSDPSHMKILIRSFLILSFVVISIYILVKRIISDLNELPQQVKDKRGKTIAMVARAMIAGFLIALLWNEILRSLMITHLPLTSWGQTFFSGARPTFYLDRLLEFSFIYFIAFVAYFLPQQKIDIYEKLLMLSSMIILLFYTYWAAYQSRYILACLPLLIILGSHLLIMIYERFNSSSLLWVRVLFKPLVVLTIIFILFKMHYINIMVSFPNDMCYF